MSYLYLLKKSKGLVKDQKIIPLKMFMNFGNVGIIQVLRFDGILLMFFTHVARPSMSSPIMAKKGSYFTPHTTFTQNALKHEKMHSSSRPFNSKNVVFQSLHTWMAFAHLENSSSTLFSSMKGCVESYCQVTIIAESADTCYNTGTILENYPKYFTSREPTNPNIHIKFLW